MKVGWPSALQAWVAGDAGTAETAEALASWLETAGAPAPVALLERGDGARWWVTDARCPDGRRWEAGRATASVEVASADLERAGRVGFVRLELGPPTDWPEGLEGLPPGGPALMIPLPGAEPRRAALVPDRPDASDRERTALLLNLGSTALARARDVARLRESESRLSRELREVARVQRRLLPSENPAIRGLDVAARLDGFGLAAGDYYDYNVLSHRFVDDPDGLEEDYWSLMVADVSGHGAAAAVEVAMLDALLRAFVAPEGGGPWDALTFVNDHFFTRLGRSHILTAFAVVFDPAAGELRYCSAGHPPPLLVRTRKGGAIEWLDDGDDIPVGVVPGHRFEGARRAFAREDLLVLYTDGVIEARSPDGEEFGSARLESVVAGAQRSAGETLAAIRSAVARHEGGSPPRDDRTLVVARRRSG